MTNVLALATVITVTNYMPCVTNGLAVDRDSAITAEIDTVMTTNTYHPNQFKETRYYPTFPMQIEEVWVECSPYLDYSAMGNEVRENPDIRITEIKRVRHIVFWLDGKEYRLKIDEKLLSTRREEREVETKERWITKEAQ